MRWTAALPKFKKDGDEDDEVVRVEDHQEDSKLEESKKPSTNTAEMAFDDETIEIKPRLDQNRMR
jgi:hypothetical protein